MALIKVPPWGARKAISGQRVGDGTYTNKIQLGSILLWNITMNVKTDQLSGDDIEALDTVAFPQKATAKLRVGIMELESMVNLYGQSIITTGSGATLKDRIRFSAKPLPYFGLAGITLASDGIGAITGFAPMCKITSDYAMFGMEFQKYQNVDLDLTLHFDPHWPTPGTTEVQTVTITGIPTGGTFTLTMDGATTSALAYNAAAATVQTALQALATIGSGNALVTGSAGGPYTVTFASALALMDVNTLSADGTLLTGGTAPAVAVTVATPGVNPGDNVLDLCRWATAPTLVLPPLAA